MKKIVNCHPLICEKRRNEKILTFDHIFYNIFNTKNDIAIISVC